MIGAVTDLSGAIIGLAHRPVSIFRDVLELTTQNRRRRSACRRAPTFVTDKAR
jgi:hypothetical protein